MKSVASKEKKDVRYIMTFLQLFKLTMSGHKQSIDSYTPANLIATYLLHNPRSTND